MAARSSSARSDRRRTPRPPDAPLHHGARAGRWWPVALIAFAAVATYANTFAHPFIFDDFGSVVRNAGIRDLSHLRTVLTPPADTSVANRPLVNLSFAINYAIGGLDVVGYHVVNVALHLACALVLFGLVRRTFETIGGEWAGARATGLACAIALLWAVHPLNSEVVDYLSERSDSMMALCYLLALYASLRAHGSPRRLPWLTAAVAACAAGMACKESMVTAPLMIALFDIVFLFGSIGGALRARWRLYAALAATWGLLATSFAARGAISTGGFASAHATWWTYLLNQTQMVTRYFRLAFWPTSLVNYYGWTRPLAFGEVWPYALVLAILFLGAIALFVKKPRIGFLGVWVFVVLAPTSSIVPIAAEVGAERRMYLPLIGIVALVVIAAEAFWRRAAFVRRADFRRDVPLVALAVITIALGATTFARNRDYASALTMARTVLARWPTPAAHHLVGAELSFAGQHEEAIAELTIAARDYAPSRFYLGNELFAAGRFDEAIASLESFIRDEPDAPVVPSARLTIARAYWAESKWPQVIEACQRVLASAPSNADAQGLLAEALMKEHRVADAIPHYEAFLQLNPSNASGWSSLGLAFITSRQPAQAAEAFGHAVDASPVDGHLRQNYARALLDLGRVNDASEQAQQAVTLLPGDPGSHDVLARVFAAAGRIADARSEFTRALQIDPNYAPAREGLRGMSGK